MRLRTPLPSTLPSTVNRLLMLVLMLAANVQCLAQPARVALVIGNAEYVSFSALPACAESSKVLAGALENLGYRVLQRHDLTSGGMAAALADFGRTLETAPDASVFVYVCGYAAGMNNRPFLLPVSATLRRPTDIMTQGILAKALLDLMSRGNPSRAVVALDLVTAPNATAPTLAALGEPSIPEGVGLIAVTGDPPAAGTTALTDVLAFGLNTPDIESGTLLSRVEEELTDSSTQIGLLRMPMQTRRLVVDEPTAPPPVVTSAPSPEVGSDTQAAQPLAAVAESTAPPPMSFPEEAEMSAPERRRVQTALANVGYYAGTIDGVFGRETRAAIRRFQYEIGAEMTGIITGAQAARLLTMQ